MTGGRWVRIDRRYNQPYRPTGYAKRAVFKWIGLVLAWDFTDSALTSMHLGALELVTTGGLIWYGVHCARRNRAARLPRLVSRPVVPAQVVISPPRGAPGERNSRVIPQDVKIAVTLRDGGRCVKCGTTADLQFDHAVPWSRGGSSTVNNVQLMCGRCNRRKGVSGAWA